MAMFKSIRWLALTAICAAAASLYAAPQPGLTPGPNATVLKDGRPFRGVGVNYFDCFGRTLQKRDDTSYDAGFQVLAEHKIPFARFSATGFWPRELGLYLTNRAEFFRRFDGVVRSAEKHGIGLIPSLFWHLPCVPDIVGEPMDQWGHPQSKTHAFMREYVREVVTRYKASPAIWAWEFGNEYNLACDLPNAAQHRPAVWPTLGTATNRTQRDEITYDMLVVALAEFGKAVRQHDPHRLITCGNSFPRESAWHNRKERSWKKDSPEQFAEMLALATPDPLNLISVHCYENALGQVGAATAAAAKAGKPLFVGEFQVAKSESPDARAALADFLGTLEKHGVPLAAIWVFDFKSQDKDFNITPANGRAWQLGVLRDWNIKFAQRPQP